jgi:indole-3-glycerol phosphate synthase
VTGTRRFSHAIAEGDGISVIAAVEDADAARAAESQRAEALVISGDPALVREATGLPILWRAEANLERAVQVADAVILSLSEEEGEEIPEQQRHQRALALGLDCAVEARSEEELQRALELLDPEIELLAEVPAGKLAIADLAVTTEHEVQELERAGVDAVIVHAADVSPLVGEAPPEV